MIKIREETLLALRLGLEYALREMQEHGEILLLVKEEPKEIGSAVYDIDGDRWEKEPEGWSMGAGRCDPWERVQDFGPITWESYR